MEESGVLQETEIVQAKRVSSGRTSLYTYRSNLLPAAVRASFSPQASQISESCSPMFGSLSIRVEDEGQSVYIVWNPTDDPNQVMNELSWSYWKGESGCTVGCNSSGQQSSVRHLHAYISDLLHPSHPTVPGNATGRSLICKSLPERPYRSSSICEVVVPTLRCSSTLAALWSFKTSCKR